MDEQIIAIFCLCDDMLKALHHREDPQCQMSDAEVMTTAIVAALHFRGNFEAARQWMHAVGYIPWMLSKSRSIVDCTAFSTCSWLCLTCWVKRGNS